MIKVYEMLGYEQCLSADLEDGFEKVAVYGDGNEYTHAARQLKSGKWTSKLGALEDIEHNVLEGLAGDAYGQVAQILRRPILSDSTSAN